MSLCQREEEGEASPQLDAVVGPGLQALAVAGVGAEGGGPDPAPHFRYQVMPCLFGILHCCQRRERAAPLHRS